MPISVLIAGLLMLYLALFPALFAYLAHRARYSLPEYWLVIVPFLWASTDYLRTTLFTGFPWCLLGYNQYSFLPAAQIAAIGGVYAVSALVALGSCFVIWIIKRDSRKATSASVAIALTLTAGALVIPTSKHASTGRSFTVGIVQPGTPPLLEYREFIESAMQRHVELTKRLKNTDVIIWPENSLVHDVALFPFFRNNIGDAAKAAGAPILINSVEYAGQDVFNSSLLVFPGGRLSRRYDKMHLVPFGEYVPIRRVFFFAGKFLREVSDFSKGKERVLFNVHGTQFASAICYEIIYAGEVAAFVRDGAEFIVTQSNDSWFEGTVMPYQHHAMAVFRAIENRRWLVRSTNSGISSIINPAGQCILRLENGRSDSVSAKIEPIDSLSIFARSHDAFAITCVLLSLCVAAPARIKNIFHRRLRHEEMTPEYKRRLHDG